MYPSIYSNHGVYEQDFFRPHPPERIREIFEKIGIAMPADVFQDVWEKAKQKSPQGEVRGQSTELKVRMVSLFF